MWFSWKHCQKGYRNVGIVTKLSSLCISVFEKRRPIMSNMMSAEMKSTIVLLKGRIRCCDKQTKGLVGPTAKRQLGASMRNLPVLYGWVEQSALMTWTAMQWFVSVSIIMRMLYRPMTRSQDVINTKIGQALRHHGYKTASDSLQIQSTCST